MGILRSVKYGFKVRFKNTFPMLFESKLMAFYYAKIKNPALAQDFIDTF
jgi:hypothetical protein